MRWMVLFAMVGLACSPDEVSVKSGEYTASEVDKRKDGKSRRDLLAAPDTYTLKQTKLVIDTEVKTVVLRGVGGEEVKLGYSVADKELWPRGCPGNFSDHVEQLLTLDGPVALGPMAIAKPVLIARCPDGDSLVLRESGDYEGFGDRCKGADGLCVSFAR